MGPLRTRGDEGLVLVVTARFGTAARYGASCRGVRTHALSCWATYCNCGLWWAGLDWAGLSCVVPAVRRTASSSRKKHPDGKPLSVIDYS